MTVSIGEKVGVGGVGGSDGGIGDWSWSPKLPLSTSVVFAQPGRLLIPIPDWGDNKDDEETLEVPSDDFSLLSSVPVGIPLSDWGESDDEGEMIEVLDDGSSLLSLVAVVVAPGDEPLLFEGFLERFGVHPDFDSFSEGLSPDLSKERKPDVRNKRRGKSSVNSLHRWPSPCSTSNQNCNERDTRLTICGAGLRNLAAKKETATGSILVLVVHLEWADGFAVEHCW